MLGHAQLAAKARPVPLSATSAATNQQTQLPQTRQPPPPPAHPGPHPQNTAHPPPLKPQTTLKQRLTPPLHTPQPPHPRQHTPFPLPSHHPPRAFHPMNPAQELSQLSQHAQYQHRSSLLILPLLLTLSPLPLPNLMPTPLMLLIASLPPTIPFLPLPPLPPLTHHEHLPRGCASLPAPTPYKHAHSSRQQALQVHTAAAAWWRPPHALLVRCSTARSAR